MSAPYLSPRPAEEIAREMVREPVSVDSPNGFCDWSGEIADERVWFMSKDDAFVSLDAIRLEVQHVITRAREEGAAAERARSTAPAMTAELRGGLAKDALRPVEFLSLEGYKAARSNVEQTIDLAYQDGFDVGRKAAATERARQQPADVALYPAPDAPGQWVAHHVTRDLVTQGDSEPHALRMLAEAIEMMDGAPEQPRDLAGRIRALIQEYAGRWADAEGGDRTAYHDVLCDLRRALESVRRGEDVRRDIDRMSDSFRAGLPEHRVRMKAAADDLEAIARECAQETKR